VEGDNNGSCGDNAGAKPTLEKGSYDLSELSHHNTVHMLAFATPFAIVNCALIAQFDNYNTTYHREKQQ
jgi:hypothetical protein